MNVVFIIIHSPPDTNLQKKSGGEFFKYKQVIDKPYLMLMSLKGVFVHRNKIYVTVQTLSEKFDVKIGVLPKEKLKSGDPNPLNLVRLNFKLPIRPCSPLHPPPYTKLFNTRRKKV